MGVPRMLTPTLHGATDSGVLYRLHQLVAAPQLDWGKRSQQITELGNTVTALRALVRGELLPAARASSPKRGSAAAVVGAALLAPREDAVKEAMEEAWPEVETQSPTSYLRQQTAAIRGRR